jgi:hypothetical protein
MVPVCGGVFVGNDEPSAWIDPSTVACAEDEHETGVDGEDVVV